jgi:hypothetical protein
MDSVWIPAFVSQAMAAVVSSVLSYEIPRWCTEIYVKATLPNTNRLATRVLLALLSSSDSGFFEENIGTELIAILVFS